MGLHSTASTRLHHVAIEFAFIIPAALENCRLISWLSCCMSSIWMCLPKRNELVRFWISPSGAPSAPAATAQPGQPGTRQPWHPPAPEEAATRSAAVPKSEHVHTGYAQPTQVQPPFGQPKSFYPRIFLRLDQVFKKTQRLHWYLGSRSKTGWKIKPSDLEKGHFSCSPRTPGEDAPMPWEVLCSAPTTQAREQEQSAAELANCSLAEINSARHFCGRC